MRIISGSYRGKKLTPPEENSPIRPTTDRAKESIFNILQGKINSETVFCDVFSGSGAMGIEALSRGVRKVYFIDSGDAAIRLIKKNLIGIKGSYEIIQSTYKAAFGRLPKRSIDLFYCDPPYSMNEGAEILNSISESDILADGGTVVIERSKKYLPPEEKGFCMTDTRKYALSAVDFFKKERSVLLSGTFDPFTKGHLFLAEKALEIFDKLYIVIFNNESKTPEFSPERRKEIIERSVSHLKNIIIDSSSGLVIDYCKENKIQYIIRGARTAEDMEYELAMSEYNMTHGGIRTLIFPAENASISSSSVRKMLNDGEDFSDFVCENAKEILHSGIKEQ